VPPSLAAMAEQEALLVEYQKAQDSAEHHDDRVHNVTTLWVGTAVLMGFVLNALTTEGAAHDHWWVLVLIAAIGIFLTVMAWLWSERANALKRLKYARCKELERELGLHQHREVGDPWRGQDWAYRALVGFFVAGWLGLLADVLGQRWPWEVPVAVVVILLWLGLGVALIEGSKIICSAEVPADSSS
jgi:hypothetical protein